MAQLYVWDVTIKEELIDKDALREIFRAIAKEWVFQLEVGCETGYRHYQGRISLREKRRLTQLRKLLPVGTHLSPSSAGGIKDWSYVQKPDTRIEGPWKFDDEPKIIPRQIKDIQLNEWQNIIVQSAETFDGRIIDVIIDTKGGIGKTTLKTYIGVHKIGKAIPFCNDYKDMLRMVMCMPKQKLYIVDMPRAISKERLNQFWSAVETIKDGYAYDDRYQFKDAYFDAPRIWVFMNEIPDTAMLSKDRWRFWKVTESGTFKALAL